MPAGGMLFGNHILVGALFAERVAAGVVGRQQFAAGARPQVQTVGCYC